jgi:diaminopimelate decarboxylase
LSARTRKPAASAHLNARPFAYRRSRLWCDDVSLESLAEKYGTPLYVYSGRQIRERLQLFQQAFAGRPSTVCFAVKSNSALAILRLLADTGAGFDIVSGGELERVRRVSKAALKRVVFSGVGKQLWEIDAALASDILLFNVESESELGLLAERAEAAGVRARFALRVNPDVFADTHPYISTGLREHKFGIDIDQARGIYRKAARSRWLDPAGVSVHIGSQIRSVEPFAAAVKRVVALAADLRADGHAIRYVDAGGGLGIDYNEPLQVPRFNAAAKVCDYATAVLRATAGLDAHLLLEPGRFIVAQAGALVTRVLFVKKNGTKTFVVADAAMNDLIRPALYQAHHEILPVVRGRSTGSMVDIVGPVCESGDFLARDRQLQAQKPGELLAVLDAGAYGMAQSSNYNTRPRPAEVLVDGAEEKLIRRRETFKDLFAPEML